MTFPELNAANARIAELERLASSIIHCETCGDSWHDSGNVSSCPICRIAELEAARRWISVDEQPMPERDDVLVLVDGRVTIGWRQGNGHCYSHSRFGPIDDCATHWRPLPDPPQELTP